MHATRTTALILTAMALLGSSARAQAPADFRELFLDLDANNDQALDRSEVPESALPAFERLLTLGDADADGRLSGAELRALGERLRGLGGEAAGRRRFADRDKDGDGKLSRDEFPGPAALFDRLDADADGFVTPQEAGRLAADGASRPTRVPPAAAVPVRFRAMDRDGDGRVSRDEFRGPAPLFDRLDTNKDGALDPREALGGPGAPAGTAPGGRSLRGRDRDGDGTLSRAEFPVAPRLFDRLDSDGDGSLSPRELRAARPGAPGPRPE